MIPVLDHLEDVKAKGYNEPEAKDDGEADEVDESRAAYIAKWVKTVKKDKDKWHKDFKRMRQNMAFVASLQWQDQKDITYDKHVGNFVNRLLAQKTATLYARNPTAVALRRKRLDFAVWDETQESLIGALQGVEQALMTGMELSPQAVALIQDYEKGTAKRKNLDKIAKTLEIVYQYQTDTQQPEFKSQMKQLVWRVGVCGVAYCRVAYCAEYDDAYLPTSETRTHVEDRAKRLEGLNEKDENDEIKDGDKEKEELSVLSGSVLDSVQDERQQAKIRERLLFDFPPATSVIPDSRCRSLKDFTGGHHRTIEYLLPLKHVNDTFGVDLKISEGVIAYDSAGEQQSSKYTTDKDGKASEPLVCVWDVLDRSSHTHFIICDGYKDYLCEPEPPEPIGRFWDVVPLTFNHVETEAGSDASIFPPSDIDLSKSAQVEYNRIMDALREHRKANSPHYVSSKGQLSPADKDALEGGVPNSVIELQAVASGQDAASVVQPMKKVPLDPMLYNTEMLREDALITTGAQEANLGPAQPNVTATAGTIAEQSRMNVAASNVDDLDDFLSALAEAGGEIILFRFSPETIQEIAGEGAAWPLFDKAMFTNELYLQIQAASSGRPNKAVDSANWERLAPLLMQSGANPQAIIRETVKRADDRLEPMDFFPLPLPPMGGGGSPPQGSGSGPGVGGPNQPLQQVPSGMSVPLAGHQ